MEKVWAERRKVKQTQMFLHFHWTILMTKKVSKTKRFKRTLQRLQGKMISKDKSQLQQIKLFRRQLTQRKVYEKLT
jgi:hypothetical protein